MEIKIPVYKVMLVRENPGTCTAINITSPQNAVPIIHEYLKFADREHFGVLMLNMKNEIIGICTISIGTTNMAYAKPKEVYKPAILSGASAIIGFHNHLSSDPTPSKEDVETTYNLHQAGKILGINFLDHIIISTGPKYFSFAANKILHL